MRVKRGAVMGRYYVGIASVLLSLCGAVLCAPPVRAQEAPEYVLDLDTGGHRAAVRALAVSGDGSVIVSAGDDKVVRVWDWQAGQMRGMLRGQIGPGSEGVINALALSGDGQAVAVAGYFGAHQAAAPPFGDVRLFDLRSGRVRRVLRGHDYVVDTLAYDAGRDELAVAGQGGVVLRWTAPFGQGEPEALTPLDTQARRVSHVAYGLGGARLIATTFDYGLRLWDLDSGAEVAVEGAEALWDTALIALAVSADGSRFAIAGEDGRVEVRAASDGAVIAALPVQPFRPDALAFVGAALVVSCGYRCGAVHRSAVWDVAAGTVVARYGGHDSGVHVAAALPGGEIVATAGGLANEIHLWRAASGAAVRQLAGVGRPVMAVGLSASADRVAWGLEDPCPELPVCPMVLGVLQRSLELPTQARSFEHPREGAGGAGMLRAVLGTDAVAVKAAPLPGGGFDAAVLSVSGAGGAFELRKSGTDGYYHSSYTLVPDRDEVISGGGNGVVLAHGLVDGGVLGEFVGHTGDVLALAAGKARLLTASADQTLKLWDMDSRRLIVSMFFAGEDWIIWTPQGYFHSSPNGDRLVGWHVNQGPDREARFIRARQLRQHLHSPEIVRRALIGGDPAAAAIDLRGTDNELEALLTRQPPEFELRLAEEFAAPDGFATIEVTGSTLEEVESWGYSVLVNDRRVPPLRVGDVSGAGRLLYQVPVEDGRNDITVSGENDFGYVTERSAMALVKARKVPKAGVLRVAVIGINAYPKLPEACNGRACDLAFPVADAVAFLSVVAERTAPLFERMESLVMVNRAALEAQPLRHAALAALVDPAQIIEPESDEIEERLEEFLLAAGAEDTTIIFVAGHGMNLDEDYYLIPSDGQKRGEKWRKSSLVDWEFVQEQINDAIGRRILVLDTCHAANAFNARLEKEAADARVVVFSATAANNTAAERKDLGHGIFTYAMLEGLRGRADTSGDGVRLLGLADYVYREVLRLSDRRQEPVYHISQTANFLLARP
ncbi:caspase family protein [Thalassovita taeanensis]|uniref:caspase family protein n=1 Tax=Thalassovita taeanensis TaxID=657014 RepID=UPI0015873323|nr:caspase family protein [Thalassovita taeanensis]